jgi:hypothetical protein
MIGHVPKRLPVGVYRHNYVGPAGPTYFVQVRVRGRLEYHGTYRRIAEAARVAAIVRAQREAAKPAPEPQWVDSRTASAGPQRTEGRRRPLWLA